MENPKQSWSNKKRLILIIIIIKYLYYFKMAKEMNISCNFIEERLHCELPKNMTDVLLNVQTKSGEHTFREDVYTRTLKYRRWNNELRPFRSLKRRVADIFCKRNSFSDTSRTTSTQTIVNDLTEQCKDEAKEKDSETDSERESIHSNWSDVVPTEMNNPVDAVLGRLNPPMQLAQLLVLFQMKLDMFKIQKVN